MSVPEKNLKSAEARVFRADGSVNVGELVALRREHQARQKKAEDEEQLEVKQLQKQRRALFSSELAKEEETQFEEPRSAAEIETRAGIARMRALGMHKYADDLLQKLEKKKAQDKDQRSVPTSCIRGAAGEGKEVEAEAEAKTKAKAEFSRELLSDRHHETQRRYLLWLESKKLADQAKRAAAQAEKASPESASNAAARADLE